MKIIPTRPSLKAPGNVIMQEKIIDNTVDRGL